MTDSLDASKSPTERSAQGQLALARDFVLSEEVFQVETEKVFSNTWIYVCHESELDGSSGCHRVNTCGSQLILLRGDEGTNRIKAFHNFCRHRGSELVTEEGCGSVGQRVQCPYHAWTYDRSGKLVSAPNMNEQPGFDKSQYGLKEVECGNWFGFVFVRFGSGKDSQSLAEFMNPLESHAKDWSFAELKVAKTIEYDVKAN